MSLDNDIYRHIDVTVQMTQKKKPGMKRTSYQTLKQIR
jgi:hypothetical protein